MINFIKKVRALAFWAILITGIALFFTTIIGGVFFELEPATVFSWFITALVVIFGVAFLLSFIAFLIWYLFSPPQAIFVLIAAIALITGAVVVCVSPEMFPFMNAEELLKPILDLLPAGLI